MMRVENPFKVLGFDKSLVVSLSPSQLKEVVRKQYLTLQQIYHPDKGGSAEMSAMLNWAREELGDNEKFELWRKKYSKSARSKGNASEVLLKRVIEDRTGFANYFFNMCLVLAQQSKESGYIDLMGIRDRQFTLVRPTIDPFGRMFLQKEDRNKPFMSIFISDDKLVILNSGGKEENYSDHLLLGLVVNYDITMFFDGISHTIGSFFHSVRKGAPLLGSEEIPERGSDRRDLIHNLSVSDFMAILPHLRQRIEINIIDGKESLTNGHLFSFSLEGGGKFCYEGLLCRLK